MGKIRIFRQIERSHIVAWFDRGHAFAYLFSPAEAVVTQDAQDARKQPLEIFTREREDVSITKASYDNPDKHFPLFRAFKIHFFDLQSAVGLACNCYTCFHGSDLVFPSMTRCCLKIRQIIRVDGPI